MTKVYKRDPKHPTYEGATSERPRAGTWESEGREFYLLVEPRDPDNAKWLHPTEGLVDLYNAHGTGELRWSVGPRDLGGGVADDILAVLHYKLTPADMAPEEWLRELVRHRFTMANLPDEEQQLIRRTDDKGDGTVRIPPDSRDLDSAMYSAMRKGLIYMGGSVSHSGHKTTMYKLTAKGRRLKAGKSNPRSRTGAPRRSRTTSAQARARNDRLRRIMRGI